MSRPGRGTGGEGDLPEETREEGAPGGARARAVITGLVQGVSYRYWTRQEAQKLGVTGWVRNLADGSVELVAEGPRAEVEKLLTACRRGPYGARVEDLEVSWQPSTGEFTRFAIVH